MSKQPTTKELLAKIQELEAKIRYGLVWEEKEPEEVEVLCNTKLPILKEIPELCVPPTNPKNPDLFELADWQKPPLDHLLIEADNYHALKVLQYTHNNKIDVIYIDPPYNTGNKDFVYNDNYVDKEDSFRHSKWLSFMSKRLKMARELMSEKGVIFISIDDNEQAQLKLLCDQIFGEGNFVANLIWKKKQGGGNDSRNFVTEHEYVLVYAKNIGDLILNLDKEHELSDNLYPFKDEKGEYGLVTLDKVSLGYIESLDFEIKDPSGKSYFPRVVKGKKSRWRWGKGKVEKDYDQLVFKNGKVYTKYRRPEGVTPKSLLFDSRFGRTETGKEALNNIFGREEFSYPKPVELIKHLLSISTQPNSIILDFMAGSGTTGQAVLELNKEDGGNRQFILITNNELNGVGSKLVESEKLKTKSEKSGESEEFDAEQFGICRRVTRERLKRVIEGYTNSKGNFVEGLSGNKLRYFRADFVEPIEEMEDETMLILAKNSLEILKIKENCFDLVELNRDYAICRSSDNNQILAVYYTEDRRKLEEFKQKVETLDKTTSCYIFSYMVSKFANFFDNNPKITVKDFPEGVYKVLKVNRE
jgi:adenine-specific DNA-methyltransferase